MLKLSTNSNTVRDNRSKFDFIVRQKTDYIVRTVEVKDPNDPSKKILQDEKFFDYGVSLWAHNWKTAFNNLMKSIDQERATIVSV